jgi:hypothetical protein
MDQNFSIEGAQFLQQLFFNGIICFRMIILSLSKERLPDRRNQEEKNIIFSDSILPHKFIIPPTAQSIQPRGNWRWKSLSRFHRFIIAVS